jgi:hypothetical protein|tara:strand:+ start:2632 stop:3063 length:432 start_codon:yes stop_codon:yes gene_type:complete
MKLIKIQQNCTEITFPSVSHLLEKAIEHSDGEYKIHDILSSLLDGRLTLWVGCSEEYKRIVFAGVTSIINYPQYSALVVTHVGAEDNKFIKYIRDIWHEDSELMKYAKLNNVKRVEILGRDGWLRVLDKVGFRKSYTALTKDI